MIPSVHGHRMALREQDPYYANVSLLLLPHLQAAGDTTIVDFSPNAHTITTVGNVNVKRFGDFADKAIEFDGASDALTIPMASSAFDLGSGDFTFEFGWKKRGTHQAYARIIQTRDGDVMPGLAVNMDITSGEYVYVNLSSNGTSANILNLGNAGLLSTTLHQRFALSKNTNTVKSFIEGAQATSSTIVGSTALYYNSAHTLVIGGQTVGTARSANVYLTYLRLTKGVGRYSSATAHVPLQRPPWNY